MATYLTSKKKADIIKKNGKSAKDTGSPEAQVALLSFRIDQLTQHLKNNKQDYSTQLGLTKMVGKRRKQLNYLMQTDLERYRALIKELNLRK